MSESISAFVALTALLAHSFGILETSNAIVALLCGIMMYLGKIESQHND